MPDNNQPQNLPEGWKRVRLGEVLKESRIRALKDDIEKRITVKLHLGGVFKRDSKEIDKVGATQYFVRKEGQFIYGKQNLHKGAIGLIPKELDGYLSTQDLPAFDVLEPAYNKYIYYYFARKHFYEKLSVFALGTGSERIYPKDLYILEILLPPLPEQQKIAEILETVDNAIEKTEKIIEKYKRIKQGLMQDLLTKGIDENGNIRNPKTHKFKNSPLGKIPEEWEVVRLGDVAELERGKFQHRPRNNPKLYGGKYPFIQTGDISSANKYIRNYKQSLNEKGIKVSKLFEKGTLVITIAANIGDTAILTFDSAFPDSVVAVKKDSQINLEFLHYLFYELKRKLNTIAIESAQKNINLEILNNLLIKFPPLPEQKRIAEILSQIDQTIEKETAYKEKLQHIKKGLMEDLLTGKVRVEL